MNNLASSLHVQSRVIYALLMREVLTRYGRHNIGFLWLFVEPMLFTAWVAAIWTALKAVHGTNLPIIAFVLAGAQGHYKGDRPLAFLAPRPHAVHPLGSPSVVGCTCGSAAGRAGFGVS